MDKCCFCPLVESLHEGQGHPFTSMDVALTQMKIVLAGSTIRAHATNPFGEILQMLSGGDAPKPETRRIGFSPERLN